VYVGIFGYRYGFIPEDPTINPRVAGFFDSPEKLSWLIFQSLTELESLAPEPAKTVALPEPPALYAVPSYTLTNEFVGRKREPEELDACARSSDTVYLVEGIGRDG
jgi:hypothetical protein